MLKTILLGKLITFPKFKMKKEGRTGTWEELIAEFEQDYGIQIRD